MALLRLPITCAQAALWTRIHRWILSRKHVDLAPLDLTAARTTTSGPDGMSAHGGGLQTAEPADRFRRPWEHHSQHTSQRGEFRGSPAPARTPDRPGSEGGESANEHGSRKDTADASGLPPPTAGFDSRRLPSPAPTLAHLYNTPARHAGVNVAPLALPPAPVQQTRLDPMLHMARMGMGHSGSHGHPHHPHYPHHPGSTHAGAPDKLERSEDATKRRRLSSREGSAEVAYVSSRTPSPAGGHWPNGASQLRVGQGSLRGGGTREHSSGPDMPGLTSKLAALNPNPAIRETRAPALHKYHNPQPPNMRDYGPTPPSPPPLMRSASGKGYGPSMGGGGIHASSSSKLPEGYPREGSYSSGSSPRSASLHDINTMLKHLHLMSSALVAASYPTDQKPPLPLLPLDINSLDPDALYHYLHSISKPLEQAAQRLKHRPPLHPAPMSSSRPPNPRDRIPIETSNDIEQALHRSQHARATLSQKCELLSKDLDEATAERDRYVLTCQDLEERIEKLESALQQAITDRNRDGAQYMSILTNAARIEMGKSKESEPDALVREVARLRRRNKELEERVASLEGVLKEFRMFASKVGNMGGEE